MDQGWGCQIEKKPEGETLVITEDKSQIFQEAIGIEISIGCKRKSTNFYNYRTHDWTVQLIYTSLLCQVLVNTYNIHAHISQKDCKSFCSTVSGSFQRRIKMGLNKGQGVNHYAPFKKGPQFF